MDQLNHRWEDGQPQEAGASRPRRRRGSIIGLVLAVSIVSATLSSAATVVLLGSAGTLATPASATFVAGGTASGAAATAATTGATEVTVAIANAVGPAVVTISASSAAGPGPFGPAAGSVGSGVVYSSDGFILTAAHVVDGASAVNVTLSDGRQSVGTIVAIDSGLDLAVVRIDARDLPVAAIGSSSGLRIGQAVVAIGSALGTYDGSVTFGVLSGTDRSVTVDNGTRTGLTLTGLLQTDAAINEGDSGGPLLDASGRVVGIIAAGSTSAQGLGFAVPIDAAAPLIQQAAASA